MHCITHLAASIRCDLDEHFNRTFTLIEPDGEKLSDSCCFCDDTNSPIAKRCKLASLVLHPSCIDIRASRLNVDNYKLLMNIGWYRYVNHVYRRMKKKMCCPAFTVRYDAEYFRIPKTQKRVLDAVTNFLMKGENPDDVRESPDVSGEVSSFDHSDAIIPYSSLRGESHDDTNDNVDSHKPAVGTESTEPGVNGSGGEIQTFGCSKSSKQKR
ncbi:Arginyl-tRNA--protein transferase 1 [Taenia solium]|eukprot:TsM_000947800 transcript=TsM_000947800 gene=TsM_000947800